MKINNSNFVNNKAEKEGATIHTTTDGKTARLYLNYVFFNNNHGKGMDGTIYNRADLASVINTVYNSKIIILHPMKTEVQYATWQQST